MSKIGEAAAAVWLAFVAGTLAAAPPKSMAELSPIERQQADFYGAIAGPDRGVTIEWVAPKSVRIDEECELVLKIHNAVNPAELLRPDLAARADWKELFQSIRDGTASPGEFHYWLKPRNPGSFEWPWPKYRVYNPRLPEGRRFQTLFQEPQSLVVLPAAPSPQPAITMALLVPDRFQEPIPEAGAFPREPPRWLWIVSSLAAILLPSAWIAIWRHRHPDEAKLARIRRAASVRWALNSLIKNKAQAESETVAAVLLTYLRQRHNILPAATTPAEIATALRLRNHPAERIVEIESLLRECDAARFGARPDGGRDLSRAARELIIHWEQGGP